MKNTSFTLVALILSGLYLALDSPDASAAFDPKSVNYTIEPIIGYEAQRKQNPDRTKVVFVYGARVTAGYRIISAEGEYTHGTSNENLVGGQNVKETTDRYRLGVRSTYDMGNILSATLRGGAETMTRSTDTTTSGTTVTTNSPSKIDPYAGLGLAIHVAKILSFQAEAVITFRDLNDMKKNDISSTLGVQIHLNTK